MAARGATLADEGVVVVLEVGVRAGHDDYLFSLARASGADRLIAGDSDLLDLEEEDLAIISLRQFRDELPSS